jgi:hypothetical protein
LQLIQVMQDTVHGAYNTDPSDPNDLPFYIADNYHQCIDLVLARPSGSGGGGSGGPAPGCTCTMGTQGLPSTSSAGVFVLFGLWLTYRARRRAPA